MNQIQSVDTFVVTSKMSEKNQIVIPAKVRRALKLRPGEELAWRLIRIANKVKAIAEPKTSAWTTATRGLGKHIWKDVPIQQYIDSLRQEWESTP